MGGAARARALDPVLDKAAVRFQVVSEGERGLLGVGYRRPVSSPRPPRRTAAEARRAVDESERGRGCAVLGRRSPPRSASSCRVEMSEDEGDRGRVLRRRPGLLIGRHGQTIDAIQELANAIAGRGTASERKEVVVDAAGYRERRRRRSRRSPLRADERCARGRAVELEPMSAVERKVVHMRLKDATGVETTSEGDGAESLRRRPTRRSSDWLAAVVATPGLTALRPGDARRVLLEDALRAVDVVAVRGPDRRRRLGRRLARDPARARAARTRGRRCWRPSGGSASSSSGWAPPNARVVCGRAEEQPVDWAGVAVAKALAPPPVAAEWCLPLVRPGGAVGALGRRERRPRAAVARVAERLARRADGVATASSSCERSARRRPASRAGPGSRRKRPLA